MYKLAGPTAESGVFKDGNIFIGYDHKTFWPKFEEWKAQGNVPEPWKTQEEIDTEANEAAEAAIRATFAEESEAAVTVTIPEGTITFNGGQDSASYIQGASDLAAALGETEVVITDIDNIPQTLSYESVGLVVVAIGKAFRDAFFKKQAALVALNS